MALILYTSSSFTESERYGALGSLNKPVAIALKDERLSI